MPIQIILDVTAPTNNATIQGPSLTVNGFAHALDFIYPAEPLERPVDVTISVTGAGSQTLHRIIIQLWSATFNITTPGTKTVRVTATYRDRQRSETRNVMVVLDEAVTIDDVITINGIEQTQAIQFFRPSLNPCPDRPGAGPCPENDIKLIAGKATILRAYVDVTNGPPMVATLNGVLETRQVGSGTWDHPPLPPLNPPVIAQPSSDIDRGNANHTLNFRIPASRCRGRLESRLTVFDFTRPGEAGYTSAPVARTLQFSNALPLRIRLVRIRYQNAERELDIPAPTIDDFWITAEYVSKTYPISKIEVIGDSEALYDGDFSSFTEQGSASGTTGLIFDILADVYRDEQHPPQVKYLALIPGWPANQTGSSGWAVGPVPMAISEVFQGSTLAQELAHLCGRNHAPCGNPGGVDFNYPEYDRYPAASIGEYGFDIVTSTVHDPADTFDFMSYCGPTWVSPYTYEALMNCLSAAGGAGFGAAEVTTRSSELLFLPATIYRDGVVLLKKPGFHLEGILPPTSGQPTPYVVELHNKEGRILKAQRLRIDGVHQTLDGAALNFLVVMPWHSETSHVVFKREEKLLHAIDVSETGPTVAITSPKGSDQLTGKCTVKWEASCDGKSLTYILRFSTNGGESWRAIATGLAASEYVVDLDTLPGGEKCVFQVLASEGIRTGKATSATFAVPRKPQDVSIISPHDGDTFAQGTSVHLFGVVSSSGGRSAMLETLGWSSSIDAYLGMGSQLIVHALSAGRHRITLSADDDCGSEVSKSIYITVLPREAP